MAEEREGRLVVVADLELGKEVSAAVPASEKHEEKDD
jgi:hypothetical protein